MYFFIFFPYISLARYHSLSLPPPPQHRRRLRFQNSTFGTVLSHLSYAAISFLHHFFSSDFFLSLLFIFIFYPRERYGHRSRRRKYSCDLTKASAWQRKKSVFPTALFFSCYVGTFHYDIIVRTSLFFTNYTHTEGSQQDITNNIMLCRFRCF